jgi:hypothetical protein
VILEACTRLSLLFGLLWSFRPPASLQAMAETAPGKSVENKNIEGGTARI